MTWAETLILSGIVVNLAATLWTLLRACQVYNKLHER